MKNSEIEKFHKACKTIIKITAIENFNEDKVVSCCVFTETGIQIYSGIDNLASYFGVSVEFVEEPYGDYIGKKFIVYDGIKYFQFVPREGER